MAGPLGVGSPWSAFVGSGGSAGLLRFTSIALACRCSSGARAVVLLSSVRLSRGGSLSCGGGCVCLAGCGRRSVRAPAPPRPTPPRNRKPTPTRTPASAPPVLASETLASSLASAAAWSCAGPQCQPHLWPPGLRAWPEGLPSNPQATARRSALPARSEDSACPRDPNEARQTASFQHGTGRC